MTLMQAIILGIAEGITEFLPISSTGHLILASRLLGLSQTEFQKSFEIAIQLGAIASVIVLYWRRFLELAVVSRVLVAFLPTGLIGLALYRVVKTYLFDSDVVVLWALGLGGVALIVFELLHREGDDAVDSWPHYASLPAAGGVSISDCDQRVKLTRRGDTVQWFRNDGRSGTARVGD